VVGHLTQKFPGGPLNSRRFPRGFLNSSRFPGVVDTLGQLTRFTYMVDARHIQLLLKDVIFGPQMHINDHK